MSLDILVGNIGCGKSTFAAILARRKNAVIVNMDTIQQMVAGGEYGAYDKEKKRVYQETEDTIIRTALYDGFNVVIDRTNMDKKRRKRFIDIGKKYTEVICYDWGEGNPKDIFKRIKSPRGIPEKQWSEVFDYMCKSYEKPTLAEGFDKIIIPPKRYKFHAFDFDGTLVYNEYPNIGEIVDGTVNYLNKLWEDIKNVIIIWSCRSGDYENQMRAFLLKNKIPFDFINENPIVDYGGRKIFANYYYDDRKCAFPI
jgi:predicted kinase